LFGTQVFHDIHTSEEVFNTVFKNADGSPTDAYTLSGGGTTSGARSYCVLMLDFAFDMSNVASLTLHEIFQDGLDVALRGFCEEYNIDIQRWMPNNALANLTAVALALGRKRLNLLILVDEYDRVFNQLMRHDPAAYRAAVQPGGPDQPMGFLRQFYLSLKSITKTKGSRVRSFTTGVAPVALTDSSGWNVAWSLSQLESFGECCGFVQADVERGLSLFDLTDAERARALLLMRRFYNGFNWVGGKRTLYLPTYVIFFKKIQDDQRARDMILQKLNADDIMGLLPWMDDDNVAVSHNVTGMLRCSSRAAVAALEDTFHQSKELSVSVDVFKDSISLAGLAQGRKPDVDLIRDPELPVQEDFSASLQYQRALMVLFYNGILQVSHYTDNGARVVLGPPHLLATCCHFKRLEMVIQDDAFFLEKLVQSPTAGSLMLLVDSVLRGWESGSLAIDRCWGYVCCGWALTVGSPLQD